MLFTSQKLQSDTEDAPLVRLKYAPVGWHYQAHCFEIKLSTIGGLYAKKPDGTDSGFCTLKFYKANGDEITSGVQLDLTLYCVKTRIVFETNHSFELVSGSIHNLTSVNDDVRLDVIAAPHISSGNGGSKVFVQRLPLRYISGNNFLRTDGRASKSIVYDPTYYSHRFHFDFEHPAGLATNHFIMMEFYKA